MAEPEVKAAGSGAGSPRLPPNKDRGCSRRGIFEEMMVDMMSRRAGPWSADKRVEKPHLRCSNSDGSLWLSAASWRQTDRTHFG